MTKLAALALCVAAPLTQGGEAPAAPAPAEESRAQIEKQLAEAQQRLDAAAREVAELSTQLGTQMGDRFIFRLEGTPPRAMLGLQVQSADAGKGALVTAVSPGGPAEAAGIRVGDQITSIGGADIAQDPNAARALVDQMRQLEPGLKVKVTVLRDGRRQDFEVTPRAAPAGMASGMGRFGAAPGMGRMPGGVRAFTLPAPPPGMGGPGGRGGPDEAMGPRGGEGGARFRGMEFATLSERLGSYFGVKSGVLVVRAGDNSAFRLQDGDVVLSIDGRVPGSATHAGRILRSYQPGEKLKLRVQRDRKAQDIEVTVPGGTD